MKIRYNSVSFWCTVLMLMAGCVLATGGIGDPCGPDSPCGSGLVCDSNGACQNEGSATTTTGTSGGTTTNTGGGGGTPGCEGNRADGLSNCGTAEAPVCVDLRVDISNCGVCSHACEPLQGGSVSCQDGTCTYVCPADMDDCDGDKTNGCETSLSSDNTHCGACDKQCSQGLVCIGGTCTQPCKAGQKVCGGACVDADLAHGCGGVSCDPCDPVHAIGGTCDVNNNCSYDTCVGPSGASNGYLDCDGDKSNGCEVIADETNCGACGTSCSATQDCASEDVQGTGDFTATCHDYCGDILLSAAVPVGVCFVDPTPTGVMQVGGHQTFPPPGNQQIDVFPAFADPSCVASDPSQTNVACSLGNLPVGTEIIACLSEGGAKTCKPDLQSCPPGMQAQFFQAGQLLASLMSPDQTWVKHSPSDGYCITYTVSSP